MQKTVLLTLGLALLVTLPATAQLGNVLTDFQSYSVELQNYLKNNLSPTLKPIEIQSQNALNDATGELNVPNPVVAGERLSNVIILNSISDKFDNNAVVKSTTANQEINRLITRSSVASVLGRNGQIRSKIKLQATQDTIENIAQIAQEAGNSHQNFLNDFQQQLGQLSNASIPGLGALLNTGQSDLQLQNIKIQSEQSKIVGETLAQTMQTNHFLQYSNLNLANISQQMEENNRSRRVSDSAEAARLLRTTSQMDLFGRKQGE
jgi:CheY-specific phosphatase CheX